MPVIPDRCGLDQCRWCDRADLPCRFCLGTGWWRPEMPRREADGTVGWVRVEEPCRMCGGTGKEHDPLPVAPRAVGRPF